MRKLKPDPVDPEKVHRILDAASKVPSGGNSQQWEFVVITDPSIKRKLRDLTVRGLETYEENSGIIERYGVVISPIIVREEDMQVLDGYCRYTTLKEMGVTKLFAYIDSLKT